MYRRLHAEKVQQEREVREKAECEAREKAKHKAREIAKQEAQEKEWWDNEFWVRYQEEQRRKHEAVDQRVAEAKMLQCQVRMPDASGSRRNGDSDVSSPSPSPAYIRLIQKQAAWVSDSEMEGKFLLMESWNREKTGASGRALVAPV